MTLPTSREGWAGVRVVVHHWGQDGAAVADNLLFLGADVTVLDGEPASHPSWEPRIELLRSLGADITFGETTAAYLPERVDVLVSSRLTWEPEGRLEEQADARGVPVWSAAEVAWRLREEAAPPWLVVGSAPYAAEETPTVAEMASAMWHAAGLRPAVVDAYANATVVEAVMDPEPADIMIVELDGRTLRRTESVCPESTAVIGSHDPGQARAFRGVRRACIYNDADRATERWVADAEVEDGARAIGITLKMPEVSMLGIVDDILVDRAFIAERQTTAAELGTLADLGTLAAEPSNLLSALAAAGLARAHGLSQQAVRDGLRLFVREGGYRDE